MDKSRLAFTRALIAAGFKRDGRHEDPLLYSLTVGDREVDVQLWKDGQHRASHSILRTLPSGHPGKHMTTRPTDFGTVPQMFRAILVELARTDHHPTSIGFLPGSGAAGEIVAERARQLLDEGWTPGHDDHHDAGDLAAAAACYALKASQLPNDARHGVGSPPPHWPGWATKWWKPRDPRRDLIRAGALIVAEIERLDRKAAKS